MSSDKENMPLTELLTPPSLRNISLEEEVNKPENKATSWEASVARNVETIPRASSPYSRKMSTLEDLELDTDEDIIDVTDNSERPSNEKRSPRPKQTDSTQGHCPTPTTNYAKLLNYCMKIAPYARLYQRQIQYYNWTAYNTLANDIGKILPEFLTDKRQKCGAILASILGSVASSVIGLAYKGISSFLHHKRHKAQNSPTYLAMNALAVAPVKPYRTKIQGILPDKRKVCH